MRFESQMQELIQIRKEEMEEMVKIRKHEMKFKLCKAKDLIMASDTRNMSATQQHFFNMIFQEIMQQRI